MVNPEEQEKLQGLDTPLGEGMTGYVTRRGDPLRPSGTSPKYTSIHILSHKILDLYLGEAGWGLNSPVLISPARLV